MISISFAAPANRESYLKMKDEERDWRRAEQARRKNTRAGYEKIMSIRFNKEVAKNGMR